MCIINCRRDLSFAKRAIKILYKSTMTIDLYNIFVFSVYIAEFLILSSEL